MRVEILSSKIHRATVTDANLNYVGSITIDEELMRAANLLENQKVEILDVNNGERFATYVIKGKKGEICLNGAAARKVCIGDIVIIVAYASMKFKKAKKFSPTIVHVNAKNEMIKK
ncbi:MULTISPECIES: aspartate 1-decarboxylase [Campylobacter]|uniref:Aspartate 1-decarboxylase n=1 Tax=Campylobacter curvus (strain 525.92) TaxID=360105 RepID=PAND_CAMC5|nr:MULTISPECIES: aspartate 1-decarboxylase [Campylobacter]A7H0Y2.1 RecName: Full=Aspartate 1-decarboxylase; AltName: Full=Aspartate alpha-decarboxylase; Contains: RecName: Full=Aspartate 1-decarboxylase beta chain; Contains: RecName: Full=Aspartate 1-decarboxylase alpha chain; Flags: Precursor [Campylobacter curvus 525.92]EAU00337.1 aspartate 1-decarboxylase [Campylobacter curvus 525.92]EJP76252.1 aspartate 1-decarboxylase [Campylobacter sp. FOBRC14]QKF62022.1 aspartate 1-decarboxylase [Campylo